MGRKIIPVNFENEPELYGYVSDQGNKADFIRRCIRQCMEGEEKKIDYNEIENRMERVLKRHMRSLPEEQPVVDEDIAEALNFFELD